MIAKEIGSGVVIADQPTAEELTELASRGFVGVVNLRHDGEPEQPLSTSAEGEHVRSLGLDYLTFGVGGVPLNVEDVAALNSFLDTHDEGKVLVHCRKGARAAALVLVREALKRGWTAEEAAEKGKELGLGVDDKLRVLVETYLRHHPNA